MLLDAHAQAVDQRNKNHRNDDDRQKRMRRENREVDRANRAGPLKFRNDTVSQNVMRDIRNEKDQRRDARRDHEPFVRRDAAALDVDIAEEQEDPAERIERRVPGREELEEGHAQSSRNKSRI